MRGHGPSKRWGDVNPKCREVRNVLTSSNVVAREIGSGAPLAGEAKRLGVRADSMEEALAERGVAEVGRALEDSVARGADHDLRLGDGPSSMERARVRQPNELRPLQDGP